MKKCLRILRHPVIFKANLENQMACPEHQKAYSVNCTGKLVCGFQDNLYSLGLLENQIGLFRRMYFWDPIRDAIIFLSISKMYINTRSIFHELLFAPHYLKITKEIV